MRLEEVDRTYPTSTTSSIQPSVDLLKLMLCEQITTNSVLKENREFLRSISLMTKTTCLFAVLAFAFELLIVMHLWMIGSYVERCFVILAR